MCEMIIYLSIIMEENYHAIHLRYFQNSVNVLAMIHKLVEKITVVIPFIKVDCMALESLILDLNHESILY